MVKDGEQFIPDQSNRYEIDINIQRYLFALNFVQDKIVADIGCGCGLGTYLYSLLAKKVIAFDHNENALEYAKKYPTNNVGYFKIDLEKEELPEHDITIALEVLEHIDNPEEVLKNLKSKELIFSIPLNSKTISPQWHKQDYKTVQDIKDLIEKYYKVDNYFIQANLWVYGKGTRK